MAKLLQILVEQVISFEMSKVVHLPQCLCPGPPFPGPLGSLQAVFDAPLCTLRGWNYLAARVWFEELPVGWIGNREVC